MQPLKEVIFSITSGCNLKCKMCAIPEQKMEELSLEQWKQVIGDIAKIGTQTVVFSGGEPLLRKDIFELIFLSRSKHLNACLTSNGMLIDECVAEKLKVAGVNVVNISVEGQPETHDYLRGKGTFTKAMGALDNLRKYNIETTIAMMVSRYNYNDMPYIMELARQYGVTTVRFQPFSLIFQHNLSERGGKDFFIEEKDIPKVEMVVKNTIILIKQYGIVGNPEEYLKRIPAYLGQQKVFSQSGCQALWTSCPVNAQGDIFPCWVITDRQRTVGSLRDKSFVEIWDKQNHRRIRDEILQNGCPGCMMSCYDQIYSKDFMKQLWLKTIKNIKKPGFIPRLKDRVIQKSRRIIFNLRTKYKFYKSYRGSWGKIFKRFLNGCWRNFKAQSEDKQDSFMAKHQEIKQLKECLLKEAQIYK